MPLTGAAVASEGTHLDGCLITKTISRVEFEHRAAEVLRESLVRHERVIIEDSGEQVLLLRPSAHEAPEEALSTLGAMVIERDATFRRRY